MITTTTKLCSRPEKRKEIAQTIKEIANQIDKRTKCEQVVTFWDGEDENTFTIIEKWSSQHDLEQYRSSRLFSVLLGVQHLLTGPMIINVESTYDKSILSRLPLQQGYSQAVV